MFNLDQVKIVSRPGYFGRKRKEIEQQLSQFPGWIECWQVHTRIYTFEEAVMIYDDSYYHFLKDHPKLELVESFGECYDSERNNIACGINHDVYSTPRHIQDVSVRRALLRLGTYFRKYRGPDEKLYDESELLHIRGEGTNGFWLMPGNVPLALDGVIREDVLPKEWVKEGSVEHFWQSNKVIVVPHES
jgi:hypothetical protein